MSAEQRRDRNHRGNLAKALKGFGLTPEAYEAMLAKQDGRCAICHREPKGRFRRLHIDHNHDTGAVRGLLCGHCNLAIGMLLDDSAVLRAAMNYLKEHEAP